MILQYNSDILCASITCMCQALPVCSESCRGNLSSPCPLRQSAVYSYIISCHPRQTRVDEHNSKLSQVAVAELPFAIVSTKLTAGGLGGPLCKKWWLKLGGYQDEPFG